MNVERQIRSHNKPQRVTVTTSQCVTSKVRRSWQNWQTLQTMLLRIPTTFRITFGTRYITLPSFQFIRLFVIFYMLWPLAVGAIAVSGAFAHLQRRPRIQVAALVMGRHFSFLLSACSRVASLQGYSEYSKIFQGIPRILEDLGGFSCFIFIYFPSLWPYVGAVKMLRLGTKGRMLLPRSDFGVFWLVSKL